mmetsp:Transcript_390/g.595  ORF Transcript_390/g.595 Transcript_390/m.595 type:complete len:89 (-) Transcript_390:178-444(-)
MQRPARLLPGVEVHWCPGTEQEGTDGAVAAAGAAEQAVLLAPVAVAVDLWVSAVMQVQYSSICGWVEAVGKACRAGCSCCQHQNRTLL